MKKMRLLMAAAAGLAAMAGAANAEEAKPTFSGNVALTSDYTFRGISQTQEGPAVQGGFDYGYGSFYAGAWGSNVDFGLSDGSLELDLYAGVKQTVGALGLDFGVIGYLYPGAADDTAELDYYEGYVKASINPTEAFTLGGALYVSPEFTGEVGTGYYTEINGALKVSDTLSFSGAVGYQKVDELVFDGDDNYTTWNLGGTVSAYGFGFDLRYVGTNTEVLLNGGDLADDRAVFSVKRAF